ncbi:hypothetical protein D3C84_1196440 [compost metagenome]
MGRGAVVIDIGKVPKHVAGNDPVAINKMPVNIVDHHVDLIVRIDRGVVLQTDQFDAGKQHQHGQRQHPPA